MPRCRRMLLLAGALLVGGAGAPAQSPGPATEEAARLVKERKWVEAQRAIEPVARAQPDNAAAQYWLGRARAGQDDIDGARAAFERAVALAPNVSDYHLWLGDSYGEEAVHASVFSKLALARKAKGEFERAVALDPRSVQAHAALVSYHLQAPGIAGGSKETALVEAQAIKRLDPYIGGLMVQQVLQATGKPDAALAELESLASAYADSAAPVAQLAVLYGNRKQFDHGFAAIDAFRQRHPGNVAAGYALGRMAAVSGQRLDEGERALRGILAGDTALGGINPAGAHWRLGMILQARGRTDQARTEYTTAARLAPHNAEIRKSLEALK